LVLQVVSFLRFFPPKPCTLFSPLPRMPRARPLHLPWLDLPNDIWGCIMRNKVCLMSKVSSVTANNVFLVYIFLLFYILPLLNFRSNLHCCLLRCQNVHEHPSQLNGEILVFQCILIFMA
jgi:hypothetical protein